MQLRIRHTTGYRYDEKAVASYNEARMTPVSTSGQYLLRSRLEVSPSPWSYEYRDYWGSTVTAFEVHEAHDEMTVVSTATVEVNPGPAHDTSAEWDELPGVADELYEFLADDDWTRPADDLVVELDALRARAATPSEYATSVFQFLYDRIRYVPGTTEVTTTAADAWEAGTGVCQDFAHLTLGALRHAGIPARYVSGYLHPSPDPQVGETVEGESHAWVEWWDGEWTGYDPTNAMLPNERHVVVARGRSYPDNPPLRGIYSATGGSELFVGVQITRVR